MFRSEKQLKSALYPGRIFTSHPVPNWTQCTVPVERTSISAKLPGHIFSATVKPVEHPSVSSKLPGRIFTAHSRPQMNWTSCTMPTDNVPMSVCKPGMIFCSQETYKQKASAPVPRRFETALSLTWVVRKSHGSSAPVIMFQCRICKTRVDKTHAALKWHVEHSHGLHTCRNAHCVAAFKTESARNIHASVHIRKTCQCDHCSEQFNHHSDGALSCLRITASETPMH